MTGRRATARANTEILRFALDDGEKLAEATTEGGPPLAAKDDKRGWLREEGEDFGGGVAVLDAEEGIGDGEIEAAWSGTARVEVEDAVAVLNGGLVGVAV